MVYIWVGSESHLKKADFTAGKSWLPENIRNNYLKKLSYEDFEKY